MVISLPKIPYTHRISMVLANPTHTPGGIGSSITIRTQLAQPSTHIMQQVNSPGIRTNTHDLTHAHATG